MLKMILNKFNLVNFLFFNFISIKIKVLVKMENVSLFPKFVNERNCLDWSDEICSRENALTTKYKTSKLLNNYLFLC